MTAAEAIESIDVIVNTVNGSDGQRWTWGSQIFAIRHVLAAVEKPAALTGSIETGDWVEVIEDGGDLPVGNRYQVRHNFGKALDLKGLDNAQNVMLFKKIEGPNAAR